MTEKLQQIPVKLIDASSDNPRKYFDPTYISELAQSIRTQGVLQPVTLQPKGKRFILIAGECRWRGSKEAGNDTVPAIVRDVDDDEADVLRHVENDQRKDLRPVERALGYLRLMEKHKLTVEQVAAKVGKSPATVRDVVALNKLIAPAKAALTDPKLKGEFTASHALWVAHVPAKQQAEVLEAALTGSDDGGVLGVRALKDLVKRDYMLLLKTARFDPKDATLVPKAGACGPCPHRSGNQPGEVAAEVDKDTCENKPCFREKEQAWLERQAKAGRQVLTAKEVKEAFDNYGHDRLEHNGDYVDAHEKPYGSKKTYGQKVAPDQVVLATSPAGRIVELVPRAVLPKEKDPWGANSSSEPRKKDASEVKAEHDLEVRRATADAAVTELMTCSSTLTADNRFFRTLCVAASRVVHSDGLKRVAKRHGFEDADGLVVLAMKSTGAELQGLALEMLLSQSLGSWLHTSSFAEELEQGCHLMGVDLVKIEKKKREELSKVWAEKAAKKKAAKKEAA